MNNQNSIFAADIALDGVYYALLRNKGMNWRLGALKAAWREDLALCGGDPDAAGLEALAKNKIWLGKEAMPPPIAVICCGLGSAWPGMGRELYDNFPAARAAMDEIASFADWDILSLMDEKDLDVINSIRKQIPYLFLFEYAQWSQFVSLGFKPDLICGHSLGELIALCLAGVYSPRSAWRLFDTHAAHLAKQAANSGQENGMLAVPASFEQITGLMAQYPDLYISNINTPGQYILSGPMPILKDIRKNLRRKRIPAFLLNMGLPFHNPGMRIMRALSYRMLMDLEMRPAAIPMLSCVTCGPYPEDQSSICGCITDLEENTVQWESMAHIMAKDYRIGAFLELGPQETLSGLIHELEPEAERFSACAKGRETIAMREACARLFSRGYLSFDLVQKQKSQRRNEGGDVHPDTSLEQSAAKPVKNISAEDNKDLYLILKLLAKETGRPAESLSFDLDLRHDLGLRSSRFPWLIQEAEKLLRRPVDLEHLFQISTVGDLALFLAGIKTETVTETKTAAYNLPFFSAPLRRFEADAQGHFKPIYLNPDHKIERIKKGDLIVLAIFDKIALRQLWTGLAPMKCKLAVPKAFLPLCASLEKAGSILAPLECGPESTEAGFYNALSLLRKEHGAPTGILFVPPCPGAADQIKEKDINNIRVCAKFLKDTDASAWLFLIWRFYAPQAAQQSAARKKIAYFLDLTNDIYEKCRLKTIFWLDQRSNPESQNKDEAGDMLALEMFYGREGVCAWLPVQDAEAPALYCPASPRLDFVFEDPAPLPPLIPGLFQGACQFSLFARPVLAEHGKMELLPDKTAQTFFPDVPYAPLSAIMEVSLRSASLLVPWLQPAAFYDLTVFRHLELPRGITRECRVYAKAEPWIMQAGQMSRICRVNSSVRALSANGRRAQSYEPFSDCLCVFAPEKRNLLAPWPLDRGAGEVKTEYLEKYYDLLSYGSAWRFVKSFKLLPVFDRDEPAYQAMLNIKDCWKSGKSESCFYFVDGIVQAAGFVLALENGLERKEFDLSKDGLWRFSFVGYLLFDFELAKNISEGFLEMRRVWKDERLARFDAQIRGADGSIILLLSHLEFERILTET